METMKIRSAQFNDTYFPVLDGVVRTVHNYALEMNRISQCYVVCPKQKGKYDDSTLPYEVIRTASVRFPLINYGLAFPKDPAAMKKIVRKGDADIIHIHSPFMVGRLGLAAARKMGVPAVATFHSKYYTDFLQVTKSNMLAKKITDNIVAFYNQCDAVWTCSEGTAETLRSYGYKKPVTVMPNGTDLHRPDNMEELKEKTVRKLGLAAGKTILLFTGSLIWQKNLKLILDTFKMLERVRPDTYQLVLAGTGNYELEIKAYAAKLKLKNVVFTGGIYDRDLLCGLYAAADLFFFPSVYDNAPLVVREAAVLQTPTLAVAGSNTADIIIPDVNGFTAQEDVTDMARTIIRITQDPELLRKTGEKAEKTIPVPWKKIVEGVYAEYEKVIGNVRKNNG